MTYINEIPNRLENGAKGKYLKVTMRSNSGRWTRAAGESYPSKVMILNASAAVVTATSVAWTESALLNRSNELGLSSVHVGWTFASQFCLSLFRVFTFTITLRFEYTRLVMNCYSNI